MSDFTARKAGCGWHFVRSAANVRFDGFSCLSLVPAGGVLRVVSGALVSGD
jgi:hypothetical protein